MEHSGYRNMDALTVWVRRLLCVQVLGLLILMVSGYWEYQLLSDFASGVYVTDYQAAMDAEANDKRQLMIGLANIGVFVVTGIVILRWIHRANYNARQLGAEQMDFSPGWAVGYFFVPFLSLWKPYQAMKEIWRASKSPSDWAFEKVDGILPLWWVLWIGSGVVSQIASRAAKGADTLPTLIKLNIATEVSYVMDIAAVVLLWKIVNRIYAFQQGSLKRQAS